MRLSWLTGLFVALVAAAPASADWVPTGPMPHEIGGEAAVLPDGRVLIAGNAPAALYDPEIGTWIYATDMLEPVRGPRVVALQDGTVLATSGKAGRRNLMTGESEIYDPRADRWTRVTPLSVARQSPSATRLRDGRVLVAGGLDSTNHALRSAELYDPVAREWRYAADLNTPRYGHIAVLLADGRVLIAGGGDTIPGGNTLSTAEIYDPVANTWTPTGSLTRERQYSRAVVLGDGRVFALGGTDEQNETLYTAEVFDHGVWTLAPSPSTLRSSATVTRLADGNVLVAGGHEASTDRIIASSEIFDFATSSWHSAGDMPLPRSDGGSITLADGRVLVYGGGFPLYGPTIPTGREWCDLWVPPGWTAPPPKPAPTPTPSPTPVPTPAPPPPAAKPKRIAVSLSIRSRVSHRATRILALSIKHVPRGATMTVDCSRGCRDFVRRDARGTVSLSRVTKRALRPGTTITVTVSRSGEIAAVKRIAIRSGRKPGVSTRCLPPGASKPLTCA